MPTRPDLTERSPSRWHRPTGAAFGLSVALVAVSAAAAAFTFFADGVLDGPAVSVGSARGTALVVLTVAAPLLALSLVAPTRTEPLALLARLGATAFLLYNSVLFLFATPINRLFLLYVAMLSLALWSTVAVLVRTDAAAFGRRCTAVPARPIAVYTWVVVALNALAWLRTIVPTLLSDDPTSVVEGSGVATNAVYVQDLAVWLPLMAVAAAWLWRRQPWGHLVTASVLTMWVIESVSIATDQWFAHAADPTSPLASATMVPVFAALAAVGAVPVVLYARALGRH